MSEIHETIEQAQEGEHAQYFNRRIALVIAVLALFLSFSETLGKSAQTEAIDANVKSSDTWAFFQAKDIRRTTLNTAADQTALLAANVADPNAKAAIDKQIEAWRATAARYESDPKTGEGRRNWPSALESRKKSASSRWRNITTTNSPRRRSRSASCWPRPR